jgi:hypothetical protein
MPSLSAPSLWAMSIFCLSFHRNLNVAPLFFSQRCSSKQRPDFLDPLDSLKPKRLCWLGAACWLLLCSTTQYWQCQYHI